MIEKILIVAAIAFVMIGVIYLVIRLSTREAPPPAPRPRDRTPLPPSARAVPSVHGQQPPAVPSQGQNQPDSSLENRNWLVGIGGDVNGKSFHIGLRTATIGRGTGNFVQTTDSDVSRVHVQFTPVPGGLQIKDRGSSNGTYVNGERVTVALLKDGDTIRVGQAKFVFYEVGRFDIDHGMDRKSAGAKVIKATMMADVRDMGAILRKMIQDANGDVAQAGRTMGVKPENMLALLAQHGIDPAEFKRRG